MTHQTITNRHETNENDEKHAFHSYFTIQSNLPPSEEWPHQTPILVTPSARANYIEYHLSQSGNYDYQSFPLDGEVVHFRGPLFHGKIVSRVRDVPARAATNEPEIFRPARVDSKKYFKGRSRQFQWSVQGQFSKRVRFDEVITGQDFGRPFRNAPAVGLVKRGLELLKPKLPETFECELFTETPRFEHPLIAGCQFFRIDRPEDVINTDNCSTTTVHDYTDDDNDGNERTLGLAGENDKGEIIEDSSLLNDPSVPRDAVARRKYFSKKENLERFHFEPDLVYTFDYYANFFSPVRHTLELTSFFRVDLAPYFNGYPLFMAMAKDKTSGQYFWGTEMWHERILNYDQKPSFMARLLGTSKTCCLSSNSGTSCER